MGIDWINEKPLIRETAHEFNIDPAFVMAIRQTENGGPGIEFGVEPPGKYDYSKQLEMTCRTVAHRLATVTFSPLLVGINGRIVYCPTFIKHFSSIWAPLGVANDPKGLNANWYANCQSAYNAFVAAGE